MTVSKTSIRDQVYSLIKERILTREYALESKLNISALAQEAGVSNTPVREALSMLHKEGLVDFCANTGYQVFSLGDGDIAALEDTMAILMMGGYEMFRFRGDTDSLAGILEKKLERQKKARRGGNLMEIAYAAIDFDSAFFNSLENAAISGFYQNLLERMVMVICYAYRSDAADLDRAFEEHVGIIEAIRADDPNLVNRLIAGHYHRRTRVS